MTSPPDPFPHPVMASPPDPFPRPIPQAHRPHRRGAVHLTSPLLPPPRPPPPSGNTGTAVVLYTDREARYLGTVLRDCKVKSTELVGAPPPDDVLRTSSKNSLLQLDKVGGSAGGGERAAGVRSVWGVGGWGGAMLVGGR